MWVLQKENFKLKIKQKNEKVEEALLKINSYFCFYNITKLKKKNLKAHNYV